MVRSILTSLNTKYVAVTLLLVGMTLCLSIPTAEAALTVKRGTQANDVELYLNVVGGSGTCQPGTTYPNLSDNVRSAWLNNGNTYNNAASPRNLGKKILAPAGTYTFSCTHTTNGSVGSDTLTVTGCLATEVWDGNDCVVAPPNNPPSANAGTDRTITLPTNSVSPSGDTATDSDGTIASTVWTKVSGSGGSITNSTTMNPTFTGLTAGSYTFRLTVTDNDAAVDTDDVIVTVNPEPNNPPTANAGSDRTIQLPVTTANTSGAAASDSDGTYTVSWSSVARPGGAPLPGITNPTTISPTFTGLTTVGTYTFRLTVTDNDGAVVTNDMNVTVTPAPVYVCTGLPVPTNASLYAGDDTGLAADTPISYSATDTGPKCQYSCNLAYWWNGSACVLPDLSATNASPAASASFSQTVAISFTGTAVNSATAPISQGGWADLEIDTNNDGNADLNYNANSGVRLGSFTQGQTKALAYTIPASTLAPGAYRYRFHVDTDGAGVAESNETNNRASWVAFTVTNASPSANAGTNQTITLPTSSASPSGVVASDSDGAVVSTVWTNTAKPLAATVSIAGATGLSPTFNGLTVAGSYTFRLTVTDDDGTSSFDDMTVTVNPPLPLPVINSFTGPATVPTNGSPTLTWNVSNVTSCTINPGAYTTSPVAAGSRAMAAISIATTYTLSCMNGGSGPTTANHTVNIADPNLVVDSTVFPAGPLVRDVATVVRGTARNAGPATTGVGFSNNFSYDTGSGWVNPGAGYVAKGVLAGGATASQDSYSYTPTALGSVRFQYCVDSYNAVAELTNETPNCVQSGFIIINPPVPSTPTGLNAVTAPACGGRIDATWNSMADTDSYRVSLDNVTYIDVGLATSYTFTSLVPGNTYTVYVKARNNISGESAAASDTAVASAVCTTLSVGNCDIPNGANSCNASVSWDLTGATSPNIYNLTRSASVSSGLATSTAGFTTSLVRSTAFGNQDTGSNVIQGRDTTTVLVSRTGSASCLSGSFFHSTANSCQPDPVVTISPAAPLVRSGERATLSFSILANYAGVTCTFSGGMSGAAVINHTASAVATSYTRTTDPLTAAQVVRITCSVPSAPAGRTVTEEVRVNVVAEPQET